MMNTKVIILIVAFLCVSQAAYTQTLKQTVREALKNNESLKSQRLLLDNSYQSLYVQSGKMLPNLSLSGSGVRSSNLKTNQNSDSYSISLNSSYTLYDFGVLSAKKKSAFYLNQAAKLSLNKAENDLIKDVTKIHLELLKAIKIVGLYRNSLEVRKQQFLAVKNRFDLGEVTKSDLLRSKASISSAEAQVELAEANVKKFKENYKTLVGKPPEAPKLPKNKINEPSSLEGSVKAALANDIMLKILGLEKKSLDEELRSAEKSRLPNLSLSGTLSYGDSKTTGNDRSSGTISLNSSLTLYSGGQKRAQVKIASNNLTAKVIDISIRKKFLERNVKNKWLDLKSITSSAIAKQEEADALKELYESIFEEWRLGGKTSLDTDQAYQSFLNSEVELVSTSIDILLAKFDLLAEIGTLRNKLQLR